MNPTLIVIDPRDSVGVVSEETLKGTMLSESIAAAQDIPRGHKIALTEIKKGELIIKYGAPIGIAIEDIPVGHWVHTHNLRTGLEGELEYTYQPVLPTEKTGSEELYFEGYLREDGRAATRNEVWIIPSVGCMNGLATRLAATADTPDVDGVYSLTHPYGCSQLGEDRSMTQTLLSALVHHPNAGAVLILSLGCEENNVFSFKEYIGEYNSERVKFMVAQEEDDELLKAQELLDECIRFASRYKRESLPVSLLRVGMKCGASDAFSGIAANPLVGAVADRINRRGGAVALSEVPEMFGAETELLNRCVDEDTFENCVSMINGFKRYFLDKDLPVYENPAPGNKDGGITTLEEKSLGCIRKGGSVPITDILDYGQRLKREGLSLVTAPGNDLVSITALAAAGATVLVFTTGRGNPLGSVIPTVKVSSTTYLAEKKPKWIDFDAGPVLAGADMDVLADRLYDKIRSVASGELTNNERNGYRDLAIWKDGATV